LAPAFNPLLAEFLPELGRSVAVTFFYGLVDIVLCRSSHEISGSIAVQHKQFNFVWQGTKVATFTLSLLMAWPVVAGTIGQPSKLDPLLDGGPTDPCAAGVDYAAGVDANGQAVVPADVAAGRVPLPDTIAIPIGGNRAQELAPGPGGSLGQRSGRRPIPGRGRAGPADRPDNASNRDSTYVALDGRKLEPLLNPAPCGAAHQDGG